MKRQILFSNEPLEITDEWRKEFFESMGHEGTDEEINEYYKRENRKVGFKAAGGINTKYAVCKGQGRK